jgi:endonuclease/exonuclease/phosphatase family metal-dependent hydrolase
MDGLSLNVVCTHLGLNRDERVGQCKVLREVMDGLDGPTVVLGDFNDFPGTPPLQMLLETPGLDDLTTADPTFMAPNPTAKIDFIFGLHVRAEGPSRVVSSVFSDHLPLIVEAEVVE